MDLESEESLYSVAVLIEELRHEDVSVRLNSVKKLPLIAAALGPERSREELIPYLTELVDDEDDILLALAEELGKLSEKVGGPSEAHVLLIPLEILATVEESLVRDKAVESMCIIGELLSNSQLSEFFVPCMKRLAQGDWYTSRISASGLFACAYTRVPAALQTDLRQLYTTLCRDDTPMVRRSAALHLGKFAAAIGATVKSDLVPLFVELAQDSQDSVRLLAIDNCISLSKVFSMEDLVSQVLPVVKACADDKVWRVRYVVADKMPELCDALGTSVAQAHVLPLFLNLLQDPEVEVKVAASAKIGAIASKLGALVDQALPLLPSLVSDSSPHVRAALASSIGLLAPVLGKQQTISHLVQHFLQLLKDEHPDVRLNIIGNLEHINKVMGVELLSQSLLPAIAELAEDKQWRIRLAIIEYMPFLAAQLGVEFFNQQQRLGNLCIAWLGDCVASIRDAAATNLRRLIEVFGSDWAQKHILPRLVQMHSHPNNVYRMTVVLSISQLANCLSTDVIQNTLLPTVIRLASDPVPNVRFNVAKCLGKLLPVVDAAAVSSQVRPCLLKLKGDSDIDVKFFADQALKVNSAAA
eukprot:GILI01005585.1.p1 GENE.GILI01005585.1~~GILI01005585.1.p1  ORF type:complete len:585 (+),score=223.80 GILI01005585.1:42-1796(+)